MLAAFFTPSGGRQKGCCQRRGGVWEGERVGAASTRRAREELGLGVWTTLEEAVSRTVTWYRDVGV